MVHFISIDFNRQRQKEVIFSLPKAFAEIYVVYLNRKGAQINYIMSVRAMVHFTHIYCFWQYSACRVSGRIYYISLS